MGKIADGTLRNWNNGETMNESDYEQEREILKVAINDNHNNIQLRYTKSELDGGQLDNRYYTESEIDDKLGSASGGESTSIRDEITFPTVTDSHVLWRSDTKKFYIADGTNWVEYAKQSSLDSTKAELDSQLSYALSLSIIGL